MKTRQTDRWTYRAYGLRLQADRPLPGLWVEKSAGRVDVSIDMREEENGGKRGPAASQRLLHASPGKDDRNVPYLRVWQTESAEPTDLCLCYTNNDACAEFHIGEIGSRIRVSWSQTMPFGDVLSYLLGPVMGCVLRLRGITCLHAGVLAFGDAAVALVGSQRSGKSTLIAALAQRGHAIMADDIASLATVDGKFYVQPGYPHLRLWRTTLEHLRMAEPEGLPRVLSHTEKYFVHLENKRTRGPWAFCYESLPLAAVYLLGKRTASTPRIFALPSPAQALFLVVANTYAGYLSDCDMRARDFDRLGRLVKHTPIRQVDRSDSLEALTPLCDALIDDMRRII